VTTEEIETFVREDDDEPHAWMPGVRRLSGPARRWMFNDKLNDARRLAWDEHARGRRWLTWVTS